MRYAGRGLVAALVLMLVPARGAGAHSSLESTASFWLRPTGIDVSIYMSRGSAALLISKGRVETIVRENFGAFEKPLSAAGAGLVALTADGREVPPDAAAASLTDEDDVCFKLHFPVVPAERFTLRASYVKQLDAGHLSSVYVLTAGNDLVTSGELTAEGMAMDVRVAGANAAAMTATPAAPVAPPPASAAVPANAAARSWVFWNVMGGSVLAVAALWWLARVRRGRRPR